MTPWKSLAVLALLVAGGIGAWRLADPAAPPPPVPAAPATPMLETAHYTIVSSADGEKTRRVAAAVESLHAAYRDFFGPPPAAATGAKLQLVLYRDQAEFKASSRSVGWAEAYYRPPVCHAYYADGRRNPYHWMLHEATHQLAREVSGFPRQRWSDEGLAATSAAAASSTAGCGPASSIATRIRCGGCRTWTWPATCRPTSPPAA